MDKWLVDSEYMKEFMIFAKDNICKILKYQIDNNGLDNMVLSD